MEGYSGHYYNWFEKGSKLVHWFFWEIGLKKVQDWSEIGANIEYFSLKITHLSSKTSRNGLRLVQKKVKMNQFYINLSILNQFETNNKLVWDWSEIGNIVKNEQKLV